ncbi:MAG: DUF6145 family protein [Lachnospiraceae bacterium]|nr:DUF6145 family protein [Lachnospiraceae bacterium]
MDMSEHIMCVSNSYEKKYFLNKEFERLPKNVKDELKIMCVLFTEEAGGILEMDYDDEGTLYLKTYCSEEDILYDDISAGLGVRRLQKEKEEFFSEIELYIKTLVLKLGDIS